MPLQLFLFIPYCLKLKNEKCLSFSHHKLYTGAALAYFGPVQMRNAGLGGLKEKHVEHGK